MDSIEAERSPLKRWLHEPLLHFLIGGAMLFAVYSVLNHGDGLDVADGRLPIRVGEGEVKWLSETWARQWQRDPSPEELRGMVTGYVRELLMAREAQELGLAENDTVVRRRLVQKMEFVLEDASRLIEPSDRELHDIYAAHPEDYQRDARVSFTHIFFNSDRRANAAGDARAALVALNDHDASPEGMGDPLMVEFEFHEADKHAVARQLGGRFADAVVALEPGEWRGPVESGFGLHLVRVSEVKPAELRDFAEAREDLLQVWKRQQKRDAEARYLDGLLKKYDVIMDDQVRSIVGPLGEPGTTNERE